MKTLKPYVFLSKKTDNCFIQVKINCVNTNFAIVNLNPTPSSGNVQTVDFILSPGSRSVMDTSQNITLSNSADTVIVRVKRNNNIVGFTVLRLYDTCFISNSNRIYYWLESINTSVIKPHFLVTDNPSTGNPNSYYLASYQSYNLNQSERKLTINYLLGDGNSTETEIMRPLFNDAQGCWYDPGLYDDIEVKVLDSAGNTCATGTTTDSEADSSGDDLF